jgi:N-acetyl-gamma-glutamyl-phosphate reductase
MNRAAIKNAAVIGNPGCYVTAATLALMPALKAELLFPDPIIVDAGSGITGAGRSEKMAYNFCEAGEAASAYGVGAHRHQPEIERNLSIAAGKKTGVVFTPHLLPMSRGIIATCYATFDGEAPALPRDAAGRMAFVRKRYEAAYRDEPFVRLLPPGVMPTTRTVRLSNYCDIQVFVVHGGAMLEVVSVLDNMVKGAAGQAVQNMNLLCAFSETAGLDAVPAAF